MGNIQAILFDCDGVLADTEKLYMQCMCDVLNNNFNYEISIEKTLELFKGSNIKQIVAYLEQENISFASQFEEVARLEYSKVPMGPEIAIDNIKETLDALKNVKKAVCSNALVKSIEKKITVIGIKDYFDVLIGGGHNPKPKPDVYLKGALALKADIYQCLAVEDSVIGLKAAIASGAITVAYAPNEKQRQELEKLRPEFIISNMHELVDLYNQLNSGDLNG